MLDAYLRELERELARQLPKEDVRARLAEAETHLREGIEGRVELGMRPEAAAREAVAAFGDARRFARLEARASRAPYDALRMRCVGMWGVGLVLSAALVRIATAHRLGNDDLLSFFGTMGCLVVLAVAAFAARRPAPHRVGALVLLQGLAVWATLSATYVRAAGAECGPYPRAEVPRALRDYGRLEQAWTGYRNGGIDALKAAGGYLAPDERRRTRDGVEAPEYFKVDLRIVPDRQAAHEAWKYFGAYGGPERVRREIAALERGRSAPARDVLDWIVRSPIPFFSPGFVLLLPLGVDFVFGSLGALAFAARRRFDRGLRA